VCNVCAIVFLTFSCLQKRSQKCASFSKRNANAFVLGDRCRRGVCPGRRLSVIEADRQTDRDGVLASGHSGVVYQSLESTQPINTVARSLGINTAEVTSHFGTELLRVDRTHTRTNQSKTQYRPDS